MRHLRNFSVGFLALVCLFGTGCASVISKELRDQAVMGLTFGEVLKNPEGHRGRVMIWGGMIIGAENKKEGTLIEILQKPLDSMGQPFYTDRSDGRFLALYEGFLDVAVFSKGREVTVAGEIRGQRILPLGDIQYAYPLIMAREIHLWPERRREEYYPPPSWYYPPYDPWLWHHLHRRPYRHRR